MCSAKQWLMKGAFITLALLPSFPTRTTLAQDDVWQKASSEGKQLRLQGRYAEAEKALLLAVAEAEKLGPENRRLALRLNELAVLYHDTGRLSEAEPPYRRALIIWERVSEPQQVAVLLNNLARLCL